MEAIQVGNWWIHKDEWEFMKAWRKEQEIRLGEYMRATPEERERLNNEWNKEHNKETFYYVNLANSDDTIHTLGQKSRLTGQIYLTKDYEVDLTQPIENTDYHYVRDSTSFDI